MTVDATGAPRAIGRAGVAPTSALALALLVALIALAIGLGHVRRQVHQVTSQLGLVRREIESVTSVRRDARKAHVRALERWLAPTSEWDTRADELDHLSAEVVHAARSFAADATGAGGGGDEGLGRLALQIGRWALDLQQLTRQPDGAASAGMLHEDLVAIDRSAAEILDARSRLGLLDDDRLARLRWAETWLLVGLATAAVALCGGLLTWQMRRAERLLSEARFRRLFQNMRDGVAVYEPVDAGADFVFTDVNEAALGAERLTREEVVGHRLTEVFPGVAEFGLLAVLARVHASGVAEHLPARYYHDDRIEGWREYYVYRLPTRELVAVYRDVTAHKEAELALRRALETTEQLIQAVPFAVVVLDAERRIQQANGAAGAILGAQPADLVGQGWSRFYGHDPGGPADAAHEVTLLDDAGSTRVVLLAELPALLDGEDVLIEAFADVTERQQLETQLRQAQKLEAIGQLAAGIAHEINTPTQFIGDNLHFLQRGFARLDRIAEEYLGEERDAWAVPRARLEYLRQEIPRALEQAAGGVERVSKIVRAMKEFSHPGAVEKTPVDLNQALESTITVARHEWRYVAEMVTDLSPDLPLVPCHLAEINQVVLNLIVNAAHAIGDKLGESPEPKGTITVATRHAPPWAELRVSDTGCGIEDRHLTKVFDPFFTTKPVGHGSGQGLAIARAVVAAKHGGQIDLQTDFGVGTTVVVRLPLEPCL